MRIGFFTESYFPEIDGVAYTLKLWKERLERRGHEVKIIYPDAEGYTPGKDEIPVRSVSNPFYSGYNIPVPASLDFPDFDIVHCHGPATLGVAGRLYAYINEVPSVYTHHTPLEEYFEQQVKVEAIADLMGKLYVPLEERFLSTFDTVTTNTGSPNRDVEAMELAAGIDMEFFRPGEESDWNLERPVAGYSGRISREKNVEQVLEMAEDFPGTVVIVGEGPAREELEEEAPGNVVFKDFLDRSKLPGYYSMLDVFVTASTGDTLGLSPLEANACGTPVVAPDVHPFDKTVQENGLKFRKEDTEDFKQKVLQAVEQDWDTRDAVKNYSVEDKIDRLEQIYQGLKEEKQHGPER